MSSSSDPRMRWVIQDVDEQTVKLAKLIAVQHSARIGEVLDLAVRVLDWQLDNTGSWYEQEKRVNTP